MTIAMQVQRIDSGLMVRTVDYHDGDRLFGSRFGLAIFVVPSVHPDLMGTCIAGCQRQPVVVLAI